MLVSTVVPSFWLVHLLLARTVSMDSPHSTPLLGNATVQRCGSRLLMRREAIL